MSALSAEEIARICHEANRAYCLTLGDFSQERWEFAPDWQKASAIHGVMFHLKHPDADDAASHENWLAVKRADGWKYGPVKNPEKKEHPCFLPFGDLPLEQQLKDRLFRSIVHAFIV